MVMCSHPQPSAPEDLEQFLLRRVGLSLNALQLGLRQAELEQAPLPCFMELRVTQPGATSNGAGLAGRSVVGEQGFNG